MSATQHACAALWTVGLLLVSVTAVQGSDSCGPSDAAGAIAGSAIGGAVFGFAIAVVIIKFCAQTRNCAWCQEKLPVTQSQDANMANLEAAADLVQRDKRLWRSLDGGNPPSVQKRPHSLLTHAETSQKAVDKDTRNKLSKPSLSLPTQTASTKISSKPAKLSFFKTAVKKSGSDALEAPLMVSPSLPSPDSEMTMTATRLTDSPELPTSLTDENVVELRPSPTDVSFSATEYKTENDKDLDDMAGSLPSEAVPTEEKVNNTCEAEPQKEDMIASADPPLTNTSTVSYHSATTETDKGTSQSTGRDFVTPQPSTKSSIANRFLAAIASSDTSPQEDRTKQDDQKATIKLEKNMFMPTVTRGVGSLLVTPLDKPPPTADRPPAVIPRATEPKKSIFMKKSTFQKKENASLPSTEEGHYEPLLKGKGQSKWLKQSGKSQPTVSQNKAPKMSKRIASVKKGNSDSALANISQPIPPAVPEEEGDFDYIDMPETIPSQSLAQSAVKKQTTKTEALEEQDTYLDMGGGQAPAEDYIELQNDMQDIADYTTITNPSSLTSNSTISRSQSQGAAKQVDKPKRNLFKQLFSPKSPQPSALVAQDNLRPHHTEGPRWTQSVVTGKANAPNEEDTYIDMSGEEAAVEDYTEVHDMPGHAAPSSPTRNVTPVHTRTDVKGKKDEKLKHGFFTRLFSSATPSVKTPTKIKHPVSLEGRSTQVSDPTKKPTKANDFTQATPLPIVPADDASGDYEMYMDTEYEDEFGDLYEEVGKAGSKVVSESAAKPSTGRALVTAEAKKESALEDLKNTPMPRGNVKRLRDHWVKKQT